MSESLQNLKLKNTYGRLLQIANGNEGVDGTLRPVRDGKGEATSLSLSSTGARVNGSFENVVDGVTYNLAEHVEDTDNPHDVTAAQIDYTPPGTGALASPVQTKLRLSITPEDYGAIGDDTTDATTAIRNAVAAAVANGVPLTTPPNKSYLIRERIDLPSDLQFVGSPSSQFVASGNDFTTTANSYGLTGVVMLINAKTGLHLRNLRIRQKDMVAGRRVNGLGVRSSSNVILDRFEAWGLNSGYAIGADSNNDLRILSPYIHDCEITGTASRQLTGICVDDNRQGGITSSDIEIASPRIFNLTASSEFVALNGYQTDGINVQRADRGIISNPFIRNVGEGIDLTGADWVITGGSLTECSDAGIKLVHGAQRNLIIGTQIYRAGYAGVTVGGSTSQNANRDTADNVFIGLLIGGIGWNGRWDGTERAAVQITDVGGTFLAPRNRFISLSTHEMGAASRELISNGSGLGCGFFRCVISGDLTGSQIFTRGNPNTIFDFALSSDASQRFGGLVSAQRILNIDDQGQIIQRLDNASTVVTPHVITAAGGNAVGNGVRVNRVFGGRNGSAVDSVAAFEALALMTDDWSTPEKRSMEYVLRCVQAGTLTTVADFNPGVATSLLLKMPDGSFRLAPVEIGASDSAGAGFRVIRTPN